MKKAILAFLVTAAVMHAIMLTLGLYSLVGSFIFERIFTKALTTDSSTFFEYSINKNEKAIEKAKAFDRLITPEDVIKNLHGDIHIIGWNSYLASSVGSEYDWILLEEDSLLDKEKNLTNFIINLTKAVSTVIASKSDADNEFLNSYTEITKEKDKKDITRKLLVLSDKIIKNKMALLKGANEIKLEENIDNLQNTLKEFKERIELYRFYYNDNLYYVSFTWDNRELRAKNKVRGYSFEVDVKNNTCRDIKKDDVLKRKYGMSAEHTEAYIRKIKIQSIIDESKV